MGLEEMNPQLGWSQVTCEQFIHKTPRILGDGGLEELFGPRFDQLMNMNNPAFNLREPVAFEVISSDGDMVEFKVKCHSAEDVTALFLWNISVRPAVERVKVDHG